MSVILEVRNVDKHFSGLAAISQLDFSVVDSEILGLIGPNGAGKTTLFNVISGFFPPTTGRILFHGSDITGLQAHEIVRLGISRTFQASTLFMKISVLENVFTGYHLSYTTSRWRRLLRTPSALEEERELRQRAAEVLDFMGLASLKEELAANLPHGHQRILGVCMALATHPKLLLTRRADDGHERRGNSEHDRSRKADTRERDNGGAGGARYESGDEPLRQDSRLELWTKDRRRLAPGNQPEQRCG